jgi:lipopolysaccharide biosynthesis glycosyltransferase
MINILYCGNEKVFDGIITTTLSIVNRTKEDLNIYVFTMDVSHLNENYTPISDAQIDFLNKIFKEKNPGINFTKIDVTEIYNKEFANCPNEQCYCSPYTLLRLFADMVDNMPDKLLYLDVDLMFNGDIKTLYDHNVEDYEYAAARDHYGKFLINPNYINAGVLLFNMKRCKETKLFEKARKLIKTEKLPFADQSAIYRSTTKKLMMKQKFNDQKFLHKSTIVRHFSRRQIWFPIPKNVNIKPWHIKEMHKVYRCFAFDKELYEYLYLKQLYENSLKQNIETSKSVA